jgi:hypothetical protein
MEAAMQRLAIVTALTVVLGLPAAADAFTCYTVLDRTDATIYQDTQPPFDLSSEGGGAARDSLRARKEFLTISETDRCPLVAAPVGATGYKPASVDEIVSSIREYARVQPGDASAAGSRAGSGRASAAPSRSSAPARKY